MPSASAGGGHPFQFPSAGFSRAFMTRPRRDRIDDPPELSCTPPKNAIRLRLYIRSHRGYHDRSMDGYLANSMMDRYRIPPPTMSSRIRIRNQPQPSQSVRLSQRTGVRALCGSSDNGSVVPGRRTFERDPEQSGEPFDPTQDFSRKVRPRSDRFADDTTEKQRLLKSDHLRISPVQ